VVWKLYEYKVFPGKFNMDFDVSLIKSVERNIPILRFYGWAPYCISLGANQSYDDINKLMALENNIDIVKRPTGGRAILHAQELTYSVIMTNCENVSGKKLYEDISNALVYGLNNYDSKLSEVRLESINPNFPSLLKEPSGALCFASTARSEIKFNGKKLVGSAQRKFGSTILQHGSILVGEFHRKLVDFLNFDNKERNNLKTEISNKTTEISSITGNLVDIHHLQDSIIYGFENVFNAKFKINEFSFTAD